MEKILIKNKEYEVVEQLGENSYVVNFKNRKVFVRKFADKNSLLNFMDVSKKIKNSGVSNPKVLMYDKKSFSFVCEYLQGEKVFDRLVKDGLSDDIYDQLFQQFWYARAEQIGLDYHTDNWMISGAKLYYLPFNYSKFTSKDEFLKNEIKQWFLSKEFAEYAKEKGVIIDESKMPSEYELNRKITLISVKYYR